MDDFKQFEYYKSEKEPGSVSPNQKKMIRYVMILLNFIILNQVAIQVKKRKA